MPDPQIAHEEESLAPVFAKNVPSKQEVQPPVSLDVPEEALYFPTLHTEGHVNNKMKENKEVSIQCG